MYHLDLGKLIECFIILHFVSMDFPSWKSRTFHRAWYKRLRDILLSKGFKMSKVDTTLFTKKLGNDLFVLHSMLMTLSLDQPIKIFVSLER
jgi:hypothetical protein